MNKKSLRGLATGILLTTIIFVFQTDTQKPVENTLLEETELAIDDLVKDYLELEQLIAIPLDEYEMLQFKVSEAAEKHNNEPQDRETVIIREIHFTVEPGMSSGEVAILLEKAGIITDSNQLQQHIINADLEGKIKSGEYIFTNQMSLEEIVDILS